MGKAIKINLLNKPIRLTLGGLLFYLVLYANFYPTVDYLFFFKTCTTTEPTLALFNVTFVQTIFQTLLHSI